MSTKSVGTFWSDYEDADSEAHFSADITRFIERVDEIVFEFSGIDGDEGPYTGRCHLQRRDGLWLGDGEFRMITGAVIPAMVKAERTDSDGFINLAGDWLDHGDQQSASFEVEISREALRSR